MKNENKACYTEGTKKGKGTCLKAPILVSQPLSTSHPTDNRRHSEHCCIGKASPFLSLVLCLPRMELMPLVQIVAASFQSYNAWAGLSRSSLSHSWKRRGRGRDTAGMKSESYWGNYLCQRRPQGEAFFKKLPSTFSKDTGQVPFNRLVSYWKAIIRANACERGPEKINMACNRS